MQYVYYIILHSSSKCSNNTTFSKICLLLNSSWNETQRLYLWQLLLPSKEWCCDEKNIGCIYDTVYYYFYHKETVLLVKQPFIKFYCCFINETFGYYWQYTTSSIWKPNRNNKWLQTRRQETWVETRNAREESTTLSGSLENQNRLPYKLDIPKTSQPLSLSMSILYSVSLNPTQLFIDRTLHQYYIINTIQV